MDIAIDFDGTVVAHEYPEIGKDIGAVPVLKKLVEQGHHLILFTMRSAHPLQDAIDWFALRKIKLHGIQFNPTQAAWTSSNKCYAQLYIDDAALGIPLVRPADGSRAYVDWDRVVDMLIDNGILQYDEEESL